MHRALQRFWYPVILISYSFRPIRLFIPFLDLSVGENKCLDRCVSKVCLILLLHPLCVTRHFFRNGQYMEAQQMVSTKLQTVAQQRSGTSM
jgi:hypothetical protein